MLGTRCRRRQLGPTISGPASSGMNREGQWMMQEALFECELGATVRLRSIRDSFKISNFLNIHPSRLYRDKSISRVMCICVHAWT